METKTINIEELKAKIEAAKTKKSKAEGAIEQLKTQLKKDFDITDLEQIPVKLTEYEAAIKRDEERLAALTKEIESVTDWAAV